MNGNDTHFFKKAFSTALVAIALQTISNVYVSFMKIPALVDDVAVIKAELLRRQVYIDSLNKLEGRISSNEDRLKTLESKVIR